MSLRSNLKVSQSENTAEKQDHLIERKQTLTSGYFSNFLIPIIMTMLNTIFDTFQNVICTSKSCDG